MYYINLPKKGRIIILILLILHLTQTINAQFGTSNILFANEVEYATMIHTGDIDMDGDNDLLIKADDGVSIYRNTSSGNFSNKELVLNSSSFLYGVTDRIKLIDIDNDNDLDLIANKVWFRNNGPGLMFTVMGNYAPQGIEATTLLEDFNGDGIVDEIGCSSNHILTLINNGNGSFSIGDTIDSYSITGTPYCFVKDINGDAINDLAIGGINTLAGWYEGLGSGHFGTRNTIAQFIAPMLPELGDIDADGDNDLITFGPAGTLLWKNNGVGAFSFFDTIATYTKRPDIVDDIDNDGDVDFSMNTGYTCDVAFIRNDSGLIWTAQNVELFSGYSNIGVHSATSDLDNDGDNDLVMASPFGVVGWYSSNSNGTFEERKNIVTQVLGWGADIDAGDVDNDGDQDIIVVSHHGKFIGLHLNNGNGTFANQQLIAQNFRAYQASFADLNMDGLLDIITNSTKYPVIWNNGGSWTTDTLPGQILGPLSFDIDGDSDPDLIGNGLWYRNDGNGIFSAVYDADIPLVSNTPFARDIDTADFNNDGILDYALPFNSDTIAILINNGTGDFTAIRFYAGFNYDMDIADMDTNGYNDVVVSVGSKLWIYFNDGMGNFTGVEKFQHPVQNTEAPTIFACDIDKDGDSDILSSWSQGYQYFNLLNRNQGSGDISISENAPGNSHTRGMLLTDLNNDSRTDYVCLSLGAIITAENYYAYKLRLKGSVFADFDLDTNLDSTERKVPYQLVHTTANNILVYTNSNGDYDIGANEGTYDLWVQPNSQYEITNNPDTLVATIDTIQPVITGLDFGVAPIIDTLINLSVNSSGVILRCNTDNIITVSLNNQGAFIPTQSVIELYIHPDITVSNIQPAADSVSGNYYYWNIDTLGWFQKWNTVLSITTGPVNSSSNITATLIFNNGTVSGIGDSIGGTVTCSYDPNDKKVSPEGYGSSGAIDLNTEWLTYTIRFQNTGNDTAFNVVIRDQLDTDLEWTSLSIISTSHDLTEITINESGRASFHFDGINLPDSNVNEVASNGFIKYRIRPKANLSTETPITNTALIYFDQNIPVVTNTVKNTLVDCNLFAPQITFNGGDSLFTTVGDNYQWFFNGDSIPGANQQYLIIDSTGDYSVTVKSIFGCIASSITLPIVCLGVNNSVSTYICDGDSLTFGNNILSSPGTYVHTFTDVAGCDSTVTINLTMSMPALISTTGDSLFASPSGIYQWYDCNTGTIIQWETSIFYHPTQSGNYACIIDQQGCVDTTACIPVIFTNLNYLDINNVSISSNPVHEVLRLEGLPNRSFEITIMDVSGKIIIREMLNREGTNVNALSAGLYFLTLKDKDNVITMKFIKAN